MQTSLGWADSGADFHAVMTITLGELIASGYVDWSDPSWRWDAYSDDQYNRLCTKIENRFWDREISIVPMGAWKRQYLRKLNEIMPKYKLLYKLIDDGVNIMQDGDEYYKSRDVFSEFPQTALNGDQDYATNGTDRESERMIEGGTLDKIEQFVARYNDIDVQILDELEELFCSLITVNINGF